MVVPLAGEVFTAQAGTGGTPVINDVLFVVEQPVALPPPFFGTTYQLKLVAAVKPLAV